MNERRRVLGAAAATLAGALAPLRRAALAATGGAAVPDDPATAAAGPGASTAPSALPADVRWETNDDEPLIGSPQAIRGGTLRYELGAYPLTFRLMGPNSNDFFAGWNRLFTFNFGLVQRHPVTDHYIPMMATHWSVQEDQRTIYFKLDPAARFSDGHPVTADDYVFTWQMMRSPHIVDPFYNTYAKQYYQSVDRIDDHTLRIVGTRWSWRPLYDFAGLWPTPAHATKLDADWVQRTNNQFQVTVGPYVIRSVVRGESVTFERVPNWWGEGRRYFIGQYNFDRIVLRVIPEGRGLDYLRRGELDLITEGSARAWHEDYDFPAVNNGWLRRARVMVDTPSGVFGLHMNLEAPIFANLHFRKAMQYLFNFDRINRNLMFDEYFRAVSFFEGTPFADPKLKSYGFHPELAKEELARAGYRRPAELRPQGFFGQLWNTLHGIVFTRSDTADVLVDERGGKASFSVIYGSQGLERHLTVIQQDFRRAGVDMQLRLLEPGAAFERALERKYEMTLVGYTSGFYPDPRQYLGTEYKKTTNNNDIWGFGTKEVDGLIRIYERDPDASARIAAMHRIDDIVQDDAFYIPFWRSPFIRIAYWDYLRFPDFYLPRRTEQLSDWLVYWIDPARKDALARDMRDGKAYPVDPEIDKDYYHIRRAVTNGG
ncbi:MAG: ABC transporter substrate-binding protein [Proteobacteria bacterium]|jgi:microcin C transport system substrate-binding protein|nr:ABC transporter substrate-binding protein [Pseudomonadota bacterium]